MSVYQRKSNGKWYFKFMINGKCYHRGVPEATDKKGAEKAEAVFKGELLQGRYNLAEKRKHIDLAKLVEEYISYSKINKVGWFNDEYIAKKFLESVGNKSIETIQPKVIEKYKEFRQTPVIEIKTDKYGNEIKTEKFIQNSTINRELNSISKMFSIAVQNGWLSENPCFQVKKLRIQNRLDRFLTKEEEQRLIDACSGDKAYLRPIVICALHTAMRKSEILNLTWSCVNLQQKYIHVLKTKSGKARKIPLSKTLLTELKGIEKISDYVFTNPETLKPYYDLNHPFQRLCKKAQITNFRFHDLRHTAATRMVSGGIDLVVVQELLGHHDITTTMRYSHPVPNRKLEAISILDG